ncbi:MAG TPA: hypothetical protein VMH87_16910 [Pseudomonadales bacterium]|nr:hypothetical protein [Pseudomonadales bacterium]
MLPEELEYPAAYFDGHACLYERATKFSNSYFGGAPHFPYKFTGKSFGPRPLHHVMRLHSNDLPGIEKRGFSELTLFYGIHYDGCTMKYKLLPPPESLFKEIDQSLHMASETGSKIQLPDLSSECHILEMEPLQSSGKWPYAGYPDLLPHVPLKLAARIPCSPKEFQGLILHGDEVKPGEVTVVIPPIYDLGISLFGHSADAEGLQLVFCCNLENKKLTIRV